LAATFDAGSVGAPRKDNSAVFRERYARTRLADYQVAAIKWLAALPNGPARILVISEDWSSDCRRDVPALARLAGRPRAPHLQPRRQEDPGHAASSRDGETKEQANTRGMKEFAAMQASPFFDLWASAGIDEILSGLYERLTVRDV
jgi:hypothetical protein